jgi:aerotolerance regulator-like protein
MIAWLNPSGFFLLVAAAVPVIIHWLLRRRAVRRPFPSVRFLTASDRSAVRLYCPSDVVLLLLRVSIIVCGALAIARPFLMTDVRHASWATRLTRAVIVDTSTSVNPARAAEAVEAAGRGVTTWRRFDSASPGPSLERAVAWLQHVEPGRREIVIVSDFQRGAITEADVARVPETIGVRPLRVESVATSPVWLEAGAVLVGGKAFARSVVADADSTTVALRSAVEIEGLEIADASAERLQRAVTEAGAVAPSSDQPIVLRFGAAGPPAGRLPDGWMRAAALRFFASPEAAGVQAKASSQDAALVLSANVAADSLAGARITQAALNARQDSSAWADREPGIVAASTLARWAREPAAPQADAWQRTTDSDGRWLWLIALALMGLEALVRRERRSALPRVEAHAA